MFGGLRRKVKFWLRFIFIVAYSSLVDCFILNVALDNGERGRWGDGVTKKANALF